METAKSFAFSQSKHGVEKMTQHDPEATHSDYTLHLHCFDDCLGTPAIQLSSKLRLIMDRQDLYLWL